MNAHENEIAVVFGASRGLGRDVARQLGAAGAHVIAVARTMGALEELDDEIKALGGACTIAPLDLADAPALGRFAQAIIGRWGRVDMLVYTAAHGAPLSPAAHIDEKDMAKSFAVNALGVQRVIRALDPALSAAPRGRAVFCVDDDKTDRANWSAYAAAKSAGAAFARAYAAEKAALGVQVSTWAPPAMPTALRARFYPGENRADLTPCADAAKALMALLA